jgi:hypothetical protein
LKKTDIQATIGDDGEAWKETSGTEGNPGNALSRGMPLEYAVSNMIFRHCGGNSLDQRTLLQDTLITSGTG